MRNIKSEAMIFKDFQKLRQSKEGLESLIIMYHTETKSLTNSLFNIYEQLNILNIEELLVPSSIIMDANAKKEFDTLKKIFKEILNKFESIVDKYRELQAKAVEQLAEVSFMYQSWVDCQ
ncbi:MAG: hypothetical protein ACFFAS_18290 [Promethearchaeota archaeon]